MALRSSLPAVVRRIVSLTIHDQPYVQVAYAPLDETDRVFEARVGNEAVYPGMSEGDRVLVHSLMNVVTRIEKA